MHNNGHPPPLGASRKGLGNGSGKGSGSGGGMDLGRGRGKRSGKGTGKGSMVFQRICDEFSSDFHFIFNGFSIDLPRFLVDLLVQRCFHGVSIDV